MSKRTHIELFAGCGGLNLGLETTGFELYFANEISPMAGETFAYNFLNEDLNYLATKNEVSEKVLWVKSNYDRENLRERLRENPFDGDKDYSDLSNDTSLEGKLLIGNVDNLIDFFMDSKKHKEISKLDIDVLSGGPPCQSFSLAGKREKNNEKNSLPLSFAKFAGLTKPKVVLLENVKGITSPFSEEGVKYYAWLEVSKAFVLEGYYPVCMMINSKYFGVPQNRPRFILLAYRKDVFSKIKRNFKDDQSKEILSISESFFKEVSANRDSLDEVTINSFKYFDIEKEPELFSGILLPKITSSSENFITVADAIHDLLDNSSSSYKDLLSANFKSEKIVEEPYNFEERRHTTTTEARFRFYQILEEIPNIYKRELNNWLTQKECKLDKQDLLNQVKDFKFLVPNKDKTKNKEVRLKNVTELSGLIKLLSTKKHSQRSLNRHVPAPAQLTIPDDICHYDFNTPRALTVREMARIQSFPDWFEFKSKVTTGGVQRRYETPQYTQVGNAVPPILGMQLGNLVVSILNKIEEQ